MTVGDGVGAFVASLQADVDATATTTEAQVRSQGDV
jgi:hypothetical protein